MPIDPNLLRGSGNPTLDQVADKLESAQAQQASAAAAPAPLPTIQAPSAPPPTISAPSAGVGPPSPGPALGAPSPSGPIKPNLPPVASAPPTDAQSRLTTLEASKPGVDQIKSPWARIPLQIANAVSTIAPGLSAAIPGTSLHHQLLVNQARRAVGTEDELASSQTKRGLEQAQTAEQESLPELHQTQGQLGAERAANTAAYQQGMLKNAAQKNENQESVGQGKIDSVLAQHGFERNEKGEIVPLSYEKMSQEQQAVHDLKAAQKEQADATAALKKAQAENAPAAAALAQRRLQSAAEAHQIAIRRLGLSEAQFELRSRGTVGGEQPEGGMISDTGKPVGTAFQQNVRPTGQERNKADLANSAHERLGELQEIVRKRPDIFGPAAGRKTNFDVWLGSQDPDAQKFRAAQAVAVDHLAGVFGGRSNPVLQKLEHAAGEFKDNPAAITAGLQELDKSTESFRKAGTVRTQGSNANMGETDPALKAYADKYFGGDIEKAKAHNQK